MILCWVKANSLTFIMYPFELDIFQTTALYHLEQGDRVYVATHRGAMIVAAEYSIALVGNYMTRSSSRSSAYRTETDMVFCRVGYRLDLIASLTRAYLPYCRQKPTVIYRTCKEEEFITDCHVYVLEEEMRREHCCSRKCRLINISWEGWDSRSCWEN